MKNDDNENDDISVHDDVKQKALLEALTEIGIEISWDSKVRHQVESNPP